MDGTNISNGLLQTVSALRQVCRRSNLKFDKTDGLAVELKALTYQMQLQMEEESSKDRIDGLAIRQDPFLPSQTNGNFMMEKTATKFESGCVRRVSYQSTLTTNNNKSLNETSIITKRKH